MRTVKGINMNHFPFNGLWKKMIFVLFISGSILLTISYYDYATVLKYQYLINSSLNPGNQSTDNNHTEVVNKTAAKNLRGGHVEEDSRFEQEDLQEEGTHETNSVSHQDTTTWKVKNLEETNRKTTQGLKEHQQASTHPVEQDSNAANLNNEGSYLVSSSKCKIKNQDPFSSDAKQFLKPSKYKRCTKIPLLTYVTKEDNIATVHVDAKLIPQYTKSTISCCYSDVSRGKPMKNRDDSIQLTTCTEFEKNVTISKEAILVRCIEHNTKEKIYENVHTSIRITSNVQNKINFYDNSTIKPLSVLFVGIDSISRLNFIRALPKTCKYVENNGWISLKGYNKIDDNTFPNLMAILTGFNQTTAYAICKPKTMGFLDKCPMLWYKYRDFSYVTAYAEDEANISTFNFNKKGFVSSPTDYYFRPYIMATERLNKVSVSSMGYCTGPETAGERILNLVKEFGVTFKNQPHFGFFWMNTFSHNEISTPTMMDNKLRGFLIDLDHKGVTNNTIIIFLSDHGIRFGDIRTTETGWLEERLPFIYFSFPPWFKDRFPREYGNFQKNTDKLTTPYDLHMTLQHVLTMSGLNHTISPSNACPRCKSLFEEIPKERSCEDARITDHWCTCAGYTQTKLQPAAEKKVAKVIVAAVNAQVATKEGGSKCAKYTVSGITTRLSHKFSYKNTSYILVILKTNPKAVFEATVSFNGDIMNSTFKTGSISRLDYYSTHSHCVSDANLKKYCYCI
ncbi:uncharacterized protein LOC125502319 isoform X1 [Dendroctonus ponderosae]|uniref:uncharacterized protein LOC109539574 isoform X1 n=2 Tax=Dendroctonus ponderosae TaxID=77166 RepID=UPI002034D6FF|nr:uncharacterized protein LOC109539574 isoform X1 [Dendroctonus ponderosae]XP_048522896.1 uncharacterized protein LOC125502319 isoform X1 [Dendroctonus ponderosae]